MDFGGYASEEKAHKIAGKASTISSQLVHSLQSVGNMRDLILEHKNSLVDERKWYEVMNSYNEVVKVQQPGPFESIKPKCSFTTLTVRDSGIAYILRLFRVYFQLKYTNGFRVKILLYDVGITSHKVDLDFSGRYPTLTMEALLEDQIFCLIKTICSGSRKLDKRISRVKGLLSLTQRPNSEAINAIQSYIINRESHLTLADLKPQLTELKREMKDNDLKAYINLVIIPLAKESIRKLSE